MSLFPKIELKLTLPEKPILVQVASSQDFYEFATLIFDRDSIALCESFYAFFLDNSRTITGFYQLSKGGLSGTVVDKRLLFAAAYLHKASAMILLHNHPSGRMEPSGADKKVTEEIEKVALIMDVPVLDHLIISPYGEYYSFADNGLLL